MADVDHTVGLAQHLLDNKVIVNRPPSGQRDPNKSLYNRYLSKAKALHSSHTNSKHNNTLPECQGISHKKKFGSITDLSLLQDVPGCSTAKEDEIDTRLQPSVMGIQNTRLVCGSEPDLSKLDVQSFPYKTDTESQQSDDHKNMAFHYNFKCNRSVPKTLQPLIPWLNEEISHDIIGIDPKDCLVFIPPGQYDDVSVPVLPGLQGVGDELPYISKIEPPRPWNPKKHKHYFTKPKIEEWKCKNHGRKVEIYAQDGSIIHQRYQGERTVDVVRQEIDELEQLMKGVGNKDSSSIVVQYQADIQQLKDMVDDTLARVIKRDSDEEEQSDIFGLRQFYKEHDEVISQIKTQHELCLQELVILETELDIAILPVSSNVDKNGDNSEEQSTVTTDMISGII